MTRNTAIAWLHFPNRIANLLLLSRRKFLIGIFLRDFFVLAARAMARLAAGALQIERTLDILETGRSPETDGVARQALRVGLILRRQ